MFCLRLFSSKSFIVSGFTFRSLIHFEFIFVYGVRKCSSFVLLHVAVQFSQRHLLKKLSLPHCIFLMSQTKGLSTLFIFSKNQLIVLLIFTIVSFISFSFISAQIFIISFLLLILGFFCSSISSCFRCKVRLST